MPTLAKQQQKRDAECKRSPHSQNATTATADKSSAAVCDGKDDVAPLETGNPVDLAPEPVPVAD